MHKITYLISISFSYLKSLVEVEWSEQKSRPEVRKGQKEVEERGCKEQERIISGLKSLIDFSHC